MTESNICLNDKPFKQLIGYSSGSKLKIQIYIYSYIPPKEDLQFHSHTKAPVLQ